MFCGIGVPIPEEILGTWAGIQSGGFGGPLVAWVVAGSGFLIRDVLCWLLGRAFGERLIGAAVSRGILQADKVEHARTLLVDNGGKAVLVGRVMVGMRAITWIVAGASRMPIGTFVAWDALGLLFTTGAFVWTGHLVGPWIIDQIGTIYANPLVGLSVGLIVGGVWWTNRQIARGSDQA